MRNAKQAAHRYGMHAEKLAGLYLRCKGYRILSERYRNHYGEIDLVAAKGKLLIAVEVKARKTIEDCEETVPPWKQQKIARALEGLLAHRDIAGLAANRQHDIRFDVIWVAPWRWPLHIRDAWRL